MPGDSDVLEGVQSGVVEDTSEHCLHVRWNLPECSLIGSSDGLGVSSWPATWLASPAIFDSIQSSETFSYCPR